MWLALLCLAVTTVMPTTQADITTDNFDQLWNFDDPAGTESKFRELLTGAQQSGDIGFQIELLTQIARTHSLRSEFEQSHALLDRAHQLLGEDESKFARGRVRYFLERGRAFNSADHPADALPLFHRALDLATANHLDFFAVDAAHMLGIAESTSEKQLEWNRKAIAIAEASSDPKARKWLASLYNNTGWTLFELKQYEPALDLFQKAVTLRANADPPEPRRLRVAKYAVARTLRAMNRFDEALALARATHAEALAADDVDPFVCEELAELLTLKGDTANAAAFAKLAYDGMKKDQWFVKHEPARLERMEKLAAPSR
jgi:tetratricopeptide (TPR) repeat protein